MSGALPRVRASIRLPRGRRLVVYGVSAGVWATGVGWLLFHYFLRRPGTFGPEPSPAEPWWLKAHGAFAFATLSLLGLLWGVHVASGWRSRRRRWSGASLVGLLATLILTGWLLYYAGGDDTTRAWIGVAHWTIGLGAPALFLLHRFARERARAEPRLAGAPFPPIEAASEPSLPPFP